MIDNSFKFHQVARKVEKRSCNAYARLRSIELDSVFATQVCNLFDELPKFANLRCGQWYLPEFDGTCYFKSTDGHTHHWKFSHNRLNLNVLKEADKHGGLLIIDSTRKGKHFPDSLSRTIPIWACVMNRVMQKLNNRLEWDTELNMPMWVHKTEKLQILDKIDAWVEGLMKAGIDWNNFTYSKPIRCIWINQTTHLDSLHEGYKNLSFIPLFLVSVSDPDHIVKYESWKYIQGAGDDHQAWSLGLTPAQFWKHKEDILKNEIECEDVIKQITKQTKLECYHAGSLASLQNQHASMIRIGQTGIYIGTNTNVSSYETLLQEQEHLLDGEIRILSCIDNEANERSSSKIMCTFIMDHKRRRDLIPTRLPNALQFIHDGLSSHEKVLILCRTGSNESICVAVAALCSFFDENYYFAETSKSVMKEHLRKGFTYVQTYINHSAPSRNMIKSISRYFTFKD